MPKKEKLEDQAEPKKREKRLLMRRHGNGQIEFANGRKIVFQDAVPFGFSVADVSSIWGCSGFEYCLIDSDGKEIVKWQPLVDYSRFKKEITE